MATDLSVAPSSVVPFGPWLSEQGTRIERALDALLPGPHEDPAHLHEAMRYASLDGGKRIRPMLVYAAGELSGAHSATLDALACAVECIHAYSLVHDDMPCMDDDVLRRGKPTVHVAFGEAVAMLAGDALQALAFESLASALTDSTAAAVAAHLVQTLARAAGSRGMAGGQAIDLASVGRAIDHSTLQRMHRLKTGAMLSASIELGLWAGGSPEAGCAAALRTFGDAIGLAFQVVDDILDVESDAATLGKTPGKDEAANKPTYVSLLGLQPAKALAGDLLEQALGVLATLDGPTQRLADLARLIVLRKA